MNSKQLAKPLNPLMVLFNVKVLYSYTEVSFNTSLYVYIFDEERICFNDLISSLSNQIPLDSFSISFCDCESEAFVYCGIYPLENTIYIGYNRDDSATNIKIKLRQIIRKEDSLRMELVEDDTENIDENNPNNHINLNSKRAKERKIGYIIQKVYMWRKLYNGITEEDGSITKLTLEEAAEKVDISKKSLDDYLIQLRIGKKFGFNFNEHRNDKVGILRAFVKKNKPLIDERKEN